MALLKTKEIRSMEAEGRTNKLKELREELMHERGVAAMGGAPPSPGKIRALRKNISRILTVLSEEEIARARAPPPVPKAPEEPTKVKRAKGRTSKKEEEKPKEESD